MKVICLCYWQLHEKIIKVNLCKKINKILFIQVIQEKRVHHKLIFSLYWFTQFEFSTAQNLPYRLDTTPFVVNIASSVNIMFFRKSLPSRPCNHMQNSNRASKSKNPNKISFETPLYFVLRIFCIIATILIVPFGFLQNSTKIRSLDPSCWCLRFQLYILGLVLKTAPVLAKS